MKKRFPRAQAQQTTSRRARAVRTGEHCPTNGWWAPDTGEAATLLIREGSIMPPSENGPVTWTLVSSVVEPRKPRYAHPAAGASIDAF